jgi:hypothetical protein
MSKDSTNSRIIFLSIHLFIFSLSVYLLSASDASTYGNVDAWQLRFEVVKSIVERFDITVPNNMGMTGADGRAYSLDSIGSALLAIPFYTLANYIGVNPEITLSLMSPLFGAATVILVFLFCMVLDYSQRTSILVAILYGFGTIAWPLSKQPFDNIIETFFMLLAIFFAYLYSKNKKTLHLFLTAFSIGFSFITRPTSLMVIPPLFIMLASLYRKEFDLKTSFKLIMRDVLLFSISFLPFICLFLWNNYYRFGSIFETGYVLRAERMGMDFFTGTSLLTGLSGFLVSPGKGFFYYSPIAILFFFSFKSFFKKYSEIASCFILIMLFYLIFLSKNINWHGDWAWGPRYLLSITPLFIIPIGPFLESRKHSKIPGVNKFIFFIIALSLTVQIAAISVDYRKYFFTLYFEDKVEFTISKGDGVQRMIEPSNKVYFDYNRSPLLAQFKFIYDISRRIKDYEYSELPDSASLADKITTNPYMNIYAFWWAHQYFTHGTIANLAIALLIMAAYSSSRLWKQVT